MIKILYIDERNYGHNQDLHVDFIKYIDEHKYARVIAYGEFMSKYLKIAIKPNKRNIKLQLNQIEKEYRPDVVLTYNCNGSSYECGLNNVARYKWVEDYLKETKLPKFHITTDYCRSGFRQEEADWFYNVGYSAAIFRHKISLQHPIKVPAYWLPFSVDRKLYEKNSIKKINMKDFKVGFLGAAHNSARSLYKNRIAAIDFFKDLGVLKISKVVNSKKFERQILTGESYVKFWTRNAFGLTCGGTCNYFTAKYFQIPASRSLLVCTETNGLDLFPEDTYLTYNSNKESLESLYEQMKSLYKDKKELEYRINKLNSLVISEHNHDQRAKQLLEIMKRHS